MVIEPLPGCGNVLTCGDYVIECTEHHPGPHKRDDRCYNRDGLTVVMWTGNWPVGTPIPCTPRDSGPADLFTASGPHSHAETR